MRIYVKISDDLGAKLTKYASDYGMSKSSFVAYALGNHIKTLDYQGDIYNGIKTKVDDYVDNNFNTLEK